MSFEKRVRNLRAKRTGTGDEPPPTSSQRNIPRPPRKRPHLAWRITRWALLAILLLAVLGTGGLAMLFYIYGRDLPRVDSLTSYDPPTVTRVYARRGELIAEYAEDNGYRTFVPLAKIPKHVLDAVMAAEDANFLKHEGLDYWGMFRAFVVNLLAGRFKQGGSTITQQVVKTLLLSPERTLSRKIKEVILARRLEQKLSKDDILTLYLNQIYFGHRRSGIEEASRYYFGKSVRKITLGEAAVLAGLIKSPGRFSPRLHPRRAKARRNEVLSNLLKASEAGKLTRRYSRAEVEAASAGPIVLARHQTPHLGVAPYYAELVKKRAEEKLGKRAFYRRNLRIHTACDVELQKAANRSLRDGLYRVARRRGYRGPHKQLEPREAKAYAAKLRKSVQMVAVGKVYDGVVLQVGRKSALVALGPVTARLPLKYARWAMRRRRRGRRRARWISDLFRASDVIRVRVKHLGAARGRKAGEVLVSLEQTPKVQGALLAMEPRSREVRALVGGYDFRESPFNRAVQARRQPGSSFKPIVYSAAIRSKRYTPASIVLDNPAVYGRIFSRHVYRPQNYDRRYRGEIRLREALAQSLNLVAVKVGDDVGIPKVREEARLLGITSPIAKGLAVALGADSLSPLELANAYAVFASGGKLATPRFIRKIVTAAGKVVYENRLQEKEVMNPAQAYVMTSLLRAPIESPKGTARFVRRLGHLVAGKTGTTNGYRDGWFVGFTPQLLAAVWVGRDDRKPLGRTVTGGGAAAPIWLNLMKKAMAGKQRQSWPTPPGVETVRIDPKSGLRSSPGQIDAIEEVFLAGTAPKEEATPSGAPTPDTLLLDEGGSTGVATTRP